MSIITAWLVIIFLLIAIQTALRRMKASDPRYNGVLFTVAAAGATWLFFLVPDNLRLPLIFAGGFLVAAFLFGPLLRLIEHRVQREKTVEPHGSIGEGEH
jgi:hypothetical protein